MCDATVIRQLLQNLLGNAMKDRHRERACRITVTTASTHNDSGQAAGWRFAVADNGIGIRAEHRESVFGMFVQVTPGGRAGQGIGPAICQRIIERHGGRIGAEQTRRWHHHQLHPAGRIALGAELELRPKRRRPAHSARTPAGHYG